LNPFLDPALDLDHEGPPRLVYIVAATPRSGSTLLCRELWSTGLLGAPYEYLNAESAMLELVLRFQTASLDEFARRLQAARTTPNGVFGLKLHWPHFLFARMYGVIEVAGVQAVMVERRDKVAQAVSWFRAIQTGAWIGGQAQAAEPAYDREAIAAVIGRIERQNALWRRGLEELGARVLHLVYEDLAADPAAAREAAFAHLGVPAGPPGRIALPPLARQSDRLSQQWISRYRDEAAALSPGTSAAPA
jgi:LPS sulfotransferase NodH